ncbi:Prefoldin subunit-domain-containing protein [Aspergillus unguis]
MGVPDNNIDGLERQRLELESNILQLQQSLYHWRTWEAEYEGLKEEIGHLDDDATTEEFLRVRHNFGGTFVNEDEFRMIIGEKQGLQRTKQQVIGLVSRRIDYVRDNVASIEKRLRAAETQMEALDAAESQPLGPTEDFPMREIIEELDEDDQLISGTTTTPGNEASSLLDILKKAGVKDIPDLPTPDGPAATEPSSEPTEEGQSSKPDKEEGENDAGKASRLESVSSESNGVSLPVSDASNTPADTEREVPVVDVDESPEDAQLRREMLRYGLDEVGAVVAELELDDGASDISVDEDYDPYPYDDDEEEEEEEDEYGRSIRPALDEDYHQQMRELEAKLNARGMWNVGKDSASLPTNMKEDLEQPSRVKIEKDLGSSAEQPAAPTKPKKKVAFAEDLDIAPAPQPPSANSEKPAPREPEVPVLSDSIVERKTVEEGAGSADAPVPKKTSRFKTARGMAGTIDPNPAAAPSDGTKTSKFASQRKTASLAPTPSMPLFPATPAEPKPFSQPITDVTEKPPSSAETKGKSKILADTLIERDVSKGSATAPEPDELDEELHRKQIATEFHQMRNRMAKQNGGSLDEEPEMVPVETEEPPKRISKFRAARMV